MHRRVVRRVCTKRMGNLNCLVAGHFVIDASESYSLERTAANCRLEFFKLLLTRPGHTLHS